MKNLSKIENFSFTPIHLFRSLLTFPIFSWSLSNTSERGFWTQWWYKNYESRISKEIQTFPNKFFQRFFTFHASLTIILFCSSFQYIDKSPIENLFRIPTFKRENSIFLIFFTISLDFAFLADFLLIKKKLILEFSFLINLSFKKFNFEL